AGRFPLRELPVPTFAPLARAGFGRCRGALRRSGGASFRLARRGGGRAGCARSAAGGLRRATARFPPPAPTLGEMRPSTVATERGLGRAPARKGRAAQGRVRSTAGCNEAWKGQRWSRK